VSALVILTRLDRWLLAAMVGYVPLKMLVPFFFTSMTTEPLELVVPSEMYTPVMLVLVGW